MAPRSGLAWKHSIDVGAGMSLRAYLDVTVLNTASASPRACETGVIDSDYRGNVGVILFNHSDQDFEGMSLFLYSIALKFIYLN